MLGLCWPLFCNRSISRKDKLLLVLKSSVFSSCYAVEAAILKITKSWQHEAFSVACAHHLFEAHQLSFDKLSLCKCYYQSPYSHNEIETALQRNTLI